MNVTISTSVRVLSLLQAIPLPSSIRPVVGVEQELERAGGGGGGDQVIEVL